jgi:OmcA/MtrC family decaheme c-type cytochrome
MLALALGACSGDDGRDGADGVNGVNGVDGVDGVDGEDAVVNTTPLESCGVCHSDGSFASAPAAHELPPIEDVSNITFAVNGADLDVTFDLAADGVPAMNYDQIQRGYRTDGTVRTTIVDDLTLTNNGGGNYTITIAGGAAEAANDNRYLFRVAAGDDRETRVYFYGDFAASPFEALVVSAEACINCHGPEGIGIHGGYYAADDGGEPCLTCHGVDGVPSLSDVSHGLHSSIWVEDGEVIHITYPTYMSNCSVCHGEEPELVAANAMPVTGSGCLSCHDEMDNDDWDFTATPFHLTNIPDPDTYDCMTGCHTNGGLATEKIVVAEFHNGLATERAGLIWDGADVSVTEAEKFVWEITGIIDDGVNLAISWQASYEGVGVDPCNDTAGVGAPVFFLPGGGSGGTFSMLRSYAQGDDFIIGMSTSAPGQAASVNLTVDNTACAGGVATTTIPVDVVGAERGIVALQGKPGVVSPANATELLRVRAPTPTYEWLVGDGAAPLMARRNIVDTGECLKCHVGSLYQHGGNRVDNVDMCILCHNSASNEKSVRVGMGVDPSEAYDGKVGETFEMKTMLHRVHSAGADGSPPYVIYRNRGIYAWAPDDSGLPNWPGTGTQVVYGSDPAVSTNHNFHATTYPRSANECTACHTEDVTEMPDQTQAMATTTDAGSTEWINQLDDTLQGATTTACITCHKDGATKGHAYQNSWTPMEFEEGRQTIIDAVN